MRTTVDLDEDILRTAKALAQYHDQSLGRVLSDLVRKGLQPPPTGNVKIRNGVALLPSRSGAQLVTDEHVKELRELDE